MEDLVIREKEIQDGLENLISKEDIDVKRQLLEKIQAMKTSQFPPWEKMTEQARQLTERINVGSELASKITKQVRSIDEQQHHVLDCFSTLKWLVQLSKNVIIMRQAMLEEKYSQAMETLRVYYRGKEAFSIHQQEITSKCSNNDNRPIYMKNMTDDIEEMDRFERELKRIILQKFATDLQYSSENIEALNESGSYLESLNLDQEGIQEICKFCEHRLRERLDHHNSIYNEEVLNYASNDSTKNRKNEQQLSAVINEIAAVIQRYERVMKNFKAPSFGLSQLLKSIHRVGEVYAADIIKNYMSHHEIRELLRKSKLNEFTSSRPNVNNDSAGEEDLELNAVLNETVRLIQYTESYHRFIDAKVCCPSNVTSNIPEKYQISRPMKTTLAVNDLIGIYTMLENSFLTLNTEKALSWEELQKESFGTSLVEELFYVYRNIGDRAMASGNQDAACTVLNLINSAISDTMNGIAGERLSTAEINRRYPYEILIVLPEEDESILDQEWLSKSALVQKKIAKLGKNVQKNITKSSIAGAASTVLSTTKQTSTDAGIDPSTRLKKWKEENLCINSPCVSLNNLEKAQEYGTQMRDYFIHRIPDIFPSTTGQKRIQHALDAIKDTVTEFAQQSREGMTKLAQKLNHRLRSFLASTLLNESSHSSFSYELSEDRFEQNQVNDPFAYAFVSRLQHTLLGLEHTLSPANFALLLESIAVESAQMFLQGMSSKRFSQLGALQLDHDLRVLTSYFATASGSGPSIQKAFGKVNQINVLLNVDDLSDVSDIVDRPVKGIPWLLSSEEVKTWLALRTEFVARIEEIRLLEL